jgi:hypothetical protein
VWESSAHQANTTLVTCKINHNRNVKTVFDNVQIWNQQSRTYLFTSQNTSWGSYPVVFKMGHADKFGDQDACLFQTCLRTCIFCTIQRPHSRPAPGQGPGLGPKPLEWWRSVKFVFAVVDTFVCMTFQACRRHIFQFVYMSMLTILN